MKTKQGGRRPGSGRKLGVPNKMSFALKEAASQYGESALDVMVQLMNDEAMQPEIRLRAASQVLDRGFGKPAVYLETSPGAVDKDLLERIKTVYDERLLKARLRQRQILIERGIIFEDSINEKHERC